MRPKQVQAALLVLPFIFSLTAADPIVELAQNQVSYHGITKGSVEHFQNIKYAHDTSGKRRFAPPEPYSPLKGSKIDATIPGAACPQFKDAVPLFMAETPDQSEDCLSLRIARPAGTTANDKLPVVVWVHGGGVVKGSAYDLHFEPDNLIALSASINKPVIYVAINYRLTIFGFARLPILKDQESLNVGMRDQRAAFQWVKDNIGAFGGDPDRITAYGLSAGGTFTSLHLMAYGGEKGVPFTQAWVMSGPPGTALNITSDATETHTLAVAETLGCGDKKQEELLTCLREISMEKLRDTAVEYSQRNHPPLGLFTFIPSIDGDFIPDRQSVLYRSGRFTKGIPMVLGWTQDDGASNAGPPALFQKEEDLKAPIQNFAHALSDEDYEELFSLYAPSDFIQDLDNYNARKEGSDPAVPIHYYRISRILRDILFTCSSIDFGFEMSRQSKAIDPLYPGVRLYELNQTMMTAAFKAFNMPHLGVIHGSDTHYMFAGLFPEGQISEADSKLSEAMAGSFINFAYTGNPSNPDDESFKAWPESFPDAQLLKGNHGSGFSTISLQTIGGPLGTGPCLLKANSQDYNIEDSELQHPFFADFDFGEMESAAMESRCRVLERDHLFKRCSYISTLSEKLGV